MFTTKQLKDRIEEARKKFGRPFAAEAGSDWKPNNVPFLTRYFDQLRQKRQQT